MNQPSKTETPSGLRERIIKAAISNWEEKSWDDMTPYEFYKNFIDSLAFGYPSSSVPIRVVVEREDFSPIDADEAEWIQNSGNQEWYQFLSGLTREQRDLIAMQLLQERHGAIHDVLAQLSYRIDSGMQITFKGEPVPTGLNGSLHHDYVGRHAAKYRWEWPEKPD